MTSMKSYGRLIPDSGKIHQNQEVWDIGGAICTLKATCYKDPPKIMVRVREQSGKSENDMREQDG